MQEFLYLSFPHPHSTEPFTLGGVPLHSIAAYHPAEVRPALRAVAQLTRETGCYAVGYVSYEAAPAFDAALQVREGSKMPLVWFGFLPPTARNAGVPEGDGHYELGKWQVETTRTEYDDAIAQIHAAIARGDTYQVNYTVRFRAPFTGDDIALFRRLRAAQQPSYNAYLNLGRFRVLSVSPELFVHWRGDTLTTRPMKGTVRRGYGAAEDKALAEWLAVSEKNRAENVMIVDLLRNDIGRVAELGSVRVPHLFDIEQYPTVYQMTSTVTATAKPNLTLEELFTAIFPCGSITGAPKVSTMRLIHALEPDPREVYCGAIGVVCPDGEAMFNVAIRTMWIDAETGMAEYSAGGGITWNSVADAEYDEVLTKAALLTEQPKEFQLTEALRLEKGNYWLLDHHLSRLTASAAYFAIPLDIQEVEARLTEYAHMITSDEPLKVRLLLSRTGDISISHTLVGETPPLPVVALAYAALSRYNRFLYHKTTYRAFYEAVQHQHPQTWNVLLWNEEGEVMEFLTGNVVVELEGQKVTPPVFSGLLPGTFRAELLETGEIQERIITLADLQRATRIWLINSVRGWIEVALQVSDAYPALVSTGKSQM